MQRDGFRAETASSQIETRSDKVECAFRGSLVKMACLLDSTTLNNVSSRAHRKSTPLLLLHRVVEAKTWEDANSKRPLQLATGTENPANSAQQTENYLEQLAPVSKFGKISLTSPTTHLH